MEGRGGTGGMISSNTEVLRVSARVARGAGERPLSEGVVGREIIMAGAGLAVRDRLWIR